MRTEVTYITDDGKKFNNQFEAKKHECTLIGHNWEFYNKNMGLQKEMNDTAYMKFCRHCHAQEIIDGTKQSS